MIHCDPLWLAAPYEDKPWFFVKYEDPTKFPAAQAYYPVDYVKKLEWCRDWYFRVKELAVDTAVQAGPEALAHLACHYHDKNKLLKEQLESQERAVARLEDEMSDLKHQLERLQEKVSFL